MTKGQMKLYTEGAENKEFLNAFKVDKNFSGVDENWGDDMKLFFAMVYEGWLIARGEYDGKRYE